jgi:hypothetical protein
MRKFSVVGFAVLVMLAGTRKSFGTESNCPMTPYQCTYYTGCAPITWCESATDCNAYQPCRVKQKSYFINRCTYMAYVTYCSSCSDPITNGDCCSSPSNQRTCPTGQNCQ